jgi:hypothetical protein
LPLKDLALGAFKFIHVELLLKPFETSGGIATGFLQRKAGIGSNESFRADRRGVPSSRFTVATISTTRAPHQYVLYSQT